ncbi:signal transduction histidine kinase [Cupriavidus necator N-1]|uniref:histidine kinase n=1 Tax=Cupriavidus necator (strain ATCC 43291 / DSM 13513 / CCUG 52238 / LMG 8453 / N-1) TaxID=1042878 RepID=F8GQH9_CUPNN|nr:MULTISPECIES: hybrid sensor histidine kinase/response regulator [Cupriavidus]AEI79451.1 signal transduction histidine kinase [Cupriavidus necator N-1]EYS97323.1 histidine kinase [Cupriavidus sp. SK-4]KAI3601825.1 CheY-like receiver [Cupriavidus necator H850]MDX6010913.1 hybrid sensor histidine kinase/response regulator [Cupriavidus necator]QUN26434.1 hybrid sensor histidine kinase/response regulator [Cupriavidus sp. KK10]
MKKALARLLGLSRPDADADISPRARARLLDMTFGRLVFSVNAIPFVGLPFVIWLYVQQLDGGALLAWTLGYGVAAVWMQLRFRRYKQEREDDDALVRRWLPFVQHVALVHGFCLSLAAVLTASLGGFDFKLLLYISIAAIVAANATHQTPILGVFQRFFVACWTLQIVNTPRSFPEHWPFVLPLALLYALAIYRHALIANQFFRQQVRLEDDGIRLAERYRLAKEEAEKALHAKNLFLTTASHDLRQPVHAMGFLIEAIARRNRDPALIPPLEDLRRSVRSVHLMFNSLLDLSRIEGGIASPRNTAVAFAPLVEEVASLFREEARSRGLDLRVRLPAGAAAVLADPALLRQSLVNLVHNALRYTKRGGVLVSARRRGSHWLLEVWDTGVGIASEEKGRVYSPFYRNEHAWRIDSAGHGLGLAVVARCATLMGATYGLDSVERRGSRFWLRFPEAKPLAPTAIEPVYEPDGLSASTLLQGVCLIVEDDPLVTAAWTSLMEAWGVQAACAASGQEALALVDAGLQPQAILCDQRLRSGESGFEVLKALFERCPDASGAMVSGEFDSEALMQAEREGYLVLHKPLEPSQLHALLFQWLCAA